MVAFLHAGLEVLGEAQLWRGPVQSYHDLVQHPQVRALDPFHSIDHPRAGEVKVLKTPIDLDEMPATITVSSSASERAHR